MATRTLLKLHKNPNLNLSLRFFCNSSFSLTRPVAPFVRLERASLSLFEPSTVSFPATLARQMATARSPRGASRRDEDDDDDDVDFDDEDMDDGDEDEFDLNDEFNDSDGDEFDDDEDEEEEKPKGKKSYTKK